MWERIAKINHVIVAEPEDFPLTEEEWDMIADVDLDHTPEITFHTKHGKEVEFVKVVRCKDCKYGSPNGRYGCKCYHYQLYETHEMYEHDFCSRAERRTE